MSDNEEGLDFWRASAELDQCRKYFRQIESNISKGLYASKEKALAALAGLLGTNPPAEATLEAERVVADAWAAYEAALKARSAKTMMREEAIAKFRTIANGLQGLSNAMRSGQYTYWTIDISENEGRHAAFVLVEALSGLQEAGLCSSFYNPEMLSPSQAKVKIKDLKVKVSELN
tara:strand:+ start:183 stop:707 length:525 start_codon:yes stop_codon:yes gene_type:complete